MPSNWVTAGSGSWASVRSIEVHATNGPVRSVDDDDSNLVVGLETDAVLVGIRVGRGTAE